MIPELDFRDRPDKGMDRYVAAAVSDMVAARDELLAAFATVTPADWDRRVPYGARTLHDLLAHLAGADHTWALAAQGLLKGEGEDRAPLTREAAAAARDRAIARGRTQLPDALVREMHRRRKLLTGLYELLEPRHLALALPAYGEEHNSVRERIWLGYHDRLHTADIRRALRSHWYPPRLRLLPELELAAAALAPDETLYVIYSVDPVMWERPSPVPGWSYRQLLAHVATGDWVLQAHLRHVIEHGSVMAWPDVDAGNAERLSQRAHSTAAALIDEYLSMRHETMLLLAKIEKQRLALPISFWWEPQPNSHTFLEYALHFPNHERQHHEQLRRAMKYAR